MMHDPAIQLAGAILTVLPVFACIVRNLMKHP